MGFIGLCPLPVSKLPEGFFMNLKETRPFLELTQIKEYQYGPGLLNYEKLNHTQNELKVKLQRLRNPIKKIRSALRIQAESVDETPKKEAWV